MKILATIPSLETHTAAKMHWAAWKAAVCPTTNCCTVNNEESGCERGRGGDHCRLQMKGWLFWPRSVGADHMGLSSACGPPRPRHPLAVCAGGDDPQPALHIDSAERHVANALRPAPYRCPYTLAQTICPQHQNGSARPAVARAHPVVHTCSTQEVEVEVRYYTDATDANHTASPQVVVHAKDRHGGGAAVLTTAAQHSTSPDAMMKTANLTTCTCTRSAA